MKKKKLEKIIAIIFFIIVIVANITFNSKKENNKENEIDTFKESYEISNIPKYNGEIYIEINNNIPNFSDEDKSIEDDYYSNLEKRKMWCSNDKN